MKGLLLLFLCLPIDTLYDRHIEISDKTLLFAVDVNIDGVMYLKIGNTIIFNGECVSMNKSLSHSVQLLVYADSGFYTYKYKEWNMNESIWIYRCIHTDISPILNNEVSFTIGRGKGNNSVFNLDKGTFFFITSSKEDHITISQRNKPIMYK